MATQTYAFDPMHSSIGFAVRHLVISKVYGRFTKWTGSLELDRADLARSRIEVALDVASLDTQVGERDAHLRSQDFFDVANHPTATFRSTAITRESDERFRIEGDLTLRGVTKPVVLEAAFNGESKDPWGNLKLGFSARGTLDRRDFGLTWNQALETGGVLVSEKVELSLEVQVARAAAASAA